MNCAACTEMIQLRLDGVEPTDVASLTSHLRECPACRALHLGAIRLQTGLRSLAAPAPPAGLARHVAGLLLTDYLQRQRKRRRLAVAAAAAILVGLGWVAWLWVPRPAVPSHGGPIARENGDRQPLPPRQPNDLPRGEVLSLTESVSEVGSAVASAATRTADAARSDLLPLVPSASLPSWQMPPTVESPALSLREAGQGVSVGLAPVTDSARRAVDFFLRELPPIDPADKPGL